MKAYEIIGGYAHICDYCEEDDGRPTLCWAKQDFDLCYSCLEKLYLQHVCETKPKDEKVIIKRRIITEDLRTTIFERDNHRCVFCDSPDDLQIDHKKPFSKGGTTSIENLQTLCRKCNMKKRDSYYGMV